MPLLFYVGSLSYTPLLFSVGSFSYTPRVVLCGGVSLTRPLLFYVGSLFYISTVLFYVGSFSYMPRAVLFGNSSYTPHAVLCGEFLLHAPAVLCREFVLRSQCCLFLRVCLTVTHPVIVSLMRKNQSHWKSIPWNNSGLCTASWPNLTIQAWVGSLPSTPKLVLWGSSSYTSRATLFVERFSYTSCASFS